MITTCRNSTGKLLIACRTAAVCDQELDDRHVLLVRSRGEVSVHDGFCGVAHLLEWAKAGGRYR